MKGRVPWPRLRGKVSQPSLLFQGVTLWPLTVPSTPTTDLLFLGKCTEPTYRHTLTLHLPTTESLILVQCSNPALLHEKTPFIDNIKTQYFSAIDEYALFFHFSSTVAFMFPRQPSPTGYHNTYQLYTMENTRQTILNDYITSQQMQVIPRPEMTRGLSPREQPVTIPYAPGARGMAFHQLNPWQGWEAVGGRGCSLQNVCLWSSGYLFQTPRSKWPSQILLICSLHWGCNWFGCCSIS